MPDRSTTTARMKKSFFVLFSTCFYNVCEKKKTVVHLNSVSNLMEKSERIEIMFETVLNCSLTFGQSFIGHITAVVCQITQFQFWNASLQTKPKNTNSHWSSTCLAKEGLVNMLDKCAKFKKVCKCAKKCANNV